MELDFGKIARIKDIQERMSELSGKTFHPRC